MSFNIPRQKSKRIVGRGAGRRSHTEYDSHLDPALIGRGGRICVDAFNKMKSMDNIFAEYIIHIGDQCIMQTDPGYPDGHPQLAKVAIQQGVIALLRRSEE